MAQGTEDTRLVDLLHTPLEAVAGERQRLIVFNPPGTYRPPEGVREATLIQPFRPAFLQLEASGLHVRPVAEGEGHDVALVALGRHRARNEQMLSQAATRLAPGGLLVAAGFKADGAASLRKRLADALPGVEHVARHHGVVMWLRPDESGMTLLRGLEPASTDGPEDFVTGPGVFSQNRVDPASFGHKVLTNRFPGARAKEVLVIHARGDSVSPTVSGHFMARSFGVPNVTPAVHTIFGVPDREAPYEGSGFFEVAFPTPVEPITNEPASYVAGRHLTTWSLPPVAQAVGVFLRDGMVTNPCTGPCDPE